MQDFRTVGGQSQALVSVFASDHPENSGEFRQSFLARWHQGIAAGQRGDFRDPGAVILPVQHDFVIFKAQADKLTSRSLQKEASAFAASSRQSFGGKTGCAILGGNSS